ncbi:MAG: branched-chain amino acid ABC transporter permease [Candidatus Dormibacteria bacterium]|jgi:branched-subunit amino acid ABC-type transport system permease component
MGLIIQSVGFGLVTASVLAVAAVGLTLQFGVTNYINFAYGTYLLLGGYLTWTLSAKAHLNFIVAALLACLLMGAIAVVIARTVMQHFVSRQAPLFYLLIVTFGLSLVISNVIEAIWGPGFQTYNIAVGSPLNLGPFSLTPNQLIIMGVAVAAMLAIHLMLTRTVLGKAMRAMSDNKDLAQVSGINTDQITMVTWFVTGCLAGLAGVALTVTTVSFGPASGSNFLFVIFAAVILGGIGKPYGAMLGALILGIITEVSAVLVSAAYKDDIAFVALIVVLLLRPQGLIASRGRA